MSLYALTGTCSTTSEPSPAATFLKDQTGAVGFAFQGFSGDNFTGNATKIYQDEGFFEFGMEISSYVWLSDETKCCVTFCESLHNATGYRCNARKREKASDPFPRIYIWCNQDFATTKANSSCS